MHPPAVIEPPRTAAIPITSAPKTEKSQTRKITACGHRAAVATHQRFGQGVFTQPRPNADMRLMLWAFPESAPTARYHQPQRKLRRRKILLHVLAGPKAIRRQD